ncbi:MAG TPA: energy transducer TonB [Puia sp.]|nr:energy transducer TonB [Puia sp.]
MQIQEISRADILDILFEGRNKDYGAYDLRKTYNRRLTKALAGMASICLLLIGGYTWAGKGHVSKIAPVVVDDVTLANALHEQPVTPPPVPKPHLQVATIRDATIHIVPDQQVKPQDVPPPNDIPDEVKIGTATHDGELSGDIVEAPSSGNGTRNVIEQPKRSEEDTKVYETVEIESYYPGGVESWKRFLLKNFRVPDEVSGTVIVKFIVDKEGNVSDVEAISGPDELKTEAVRVIKKSGKWTPAIQNGRKVNSYKKQPIIVRLENE